MTTESHDPTEPPDSPCPWWCQDSERAGTPLHPATHEGYDLVVNAERPDQVPTVLHALLTLPLGGSVVRVLLADGDTDLLTLSSAASRSLAAALVRLADVVEGLVSL
ncbi:MAG: DUF6907 domain-containing protein [Frankiaceae bacterium]